jgi:uncharacterized membrane protein
MKSITYRVICIISLLAVTFLLTGDIYQSTAITVVFQTLQTFLYYLHERAWARRRARDAAPVAGCRCRGRERVPRST